MDTVIIDAGTLELNAEDMTATGLLIPYGVPARSNLGTFTFAAGDVTIPTDVTGMSLNVEHARENVVGGFTKLWEQPEGTFASFKFASTDAGRQAFADAQSGKRKNLSAEVAHVRIRDGKAMPGAVLFAGSVVEHPAFEGATLLAALDTPSSDAYDSPEAASSSTYVTEFTDDQGVRWRRIEANTNTTTVERIEEPPAEAPAEDPTEQEKETIMTASAVTEPGQQAPAAVVPSTLLASAPTAPAPEAGKPTEVDLGTVFASMALLKSQRPDVSRDQRAEAETLLAALSDIKAEAAGGLTTAGSGITQPAWVGRLWQGRRYQRKYLDLLTHLYGGIQLGGRKGFKLDQGTALVTKWAGNKAAIGSGTASTSLASATVQPYGYAADVAREWFDLEGGAEVIQAFFEGVTDSYAKVTDLDALTAILTAATKTAAANDRLVAPGTFPSVDGHDYTGAMGMVIQGIEAIYDADDEASFSIVNGTAWKQLLYTAKDLVPEYVSFAIGAGRGEADADGKVRIVKAPDAYFAGLDAAAPQVVVGASAAIEFREQGTTPIQIDAVDIAKGGIDRAVIGYLETFIVRPESLVAIGTKSA
nr:hypothetical protein [Microbacterium bovistercoris]